MIKAVKYSVCLLAALIFLVFCGENAYHEFYDITLEDFNSIVFQKAYDKTEVAADLEDISKRYDLCGYYNIYEYSDSDIDIYCCTNGSRSEVVKKLGVDSCDFNTILNGSYSIIITDDDKRDSIVTGDYVIPNFSFAADEDTARQIYNELSEKYSIIFEPTKPFSSKCTGVWLICAALFALMAVYDMIGSKKEVCIKLTLGNSLIRQLAVILLRDSVVFFVIGSAVAAIMSPFTAVVMVINRFVFFILSLCAINALVFCGLFFTDICSAMKNENNSFAYMPINYVLKTIAAAVMLCVLCAAGKLPLLETKQHSAEETAASFGDANRIELSESPLWAIMIDEYGYETTDEEGHYKVGELLDKEMADYQTFLNSLNDKYGLFLLNGFEFYGMQDDLSNISRQNIVIASDAALSHIAEKTHISPEENGITIMLPNGHKGRDQRAVDLWLEMLSENYDVKVTYKNYDKAEITVFDYMGNSDIAATTPAAAVASSPIIICVPNAADYNFFNMQTVFSSANKSECEALLKRNNIHSTRIDVSTLHSLTDGYIRKIISVRSFFILTFSAVSVYYLALLVSTVLMDIRLYKRERAVKKVLGRTFAERYMPLSLKTTSLLAASLVVSVAAVRRYDIGNIKIIYISAAVMLVTEIVIELAAAKADERRNTLRELKGGAL